MEGNGERGHGVTRREGIGRGWMWIAKTTAEPCLFSCARPRRGKGMPISKAPGTFGNLFVKFDVAFPRTLQPEQKEAIRSVLG